MGGGGEWAGEIGVRRRCGAQQERDLRGGSLSRSQFGLSLYVLCVLTGFAQGNRARTGPPGSHKLTGFANDHRARRIKDVIKIVSQSRFVAWLDTDAATAVTGARLT